MMLRILFQPQANWAKGSVRRSLNFVWNAEGRERKSAGLFAGGVIGGRDGVRPPKLLLRLVYSLLPALLSLLADGRMLAYVKLKFTDQFFQIVKVRAGGPMEAVPGNARGQLNDDLVFLNALFVFAFVDKIVELAMQGTSAASAARQVERSKGFVSGVVCKAAGLSACNVNGH